MSTVIDSLIVSLGLDATKFTKGQKEATESLKKTENQSNRTSKELEAHAKRSAQAFSNLKNELLAVAALYVSFSGIKSFIQNTVLQTASLGRMSDNLGMNAKELAQWQLAAKHAGGTAESMVDSIRGANDTISKLRLGQNSEQLQATYNYAGVGGVNVGEVKSGTDLLLKQADIIKNINEKFGANQARMAAEQMGIHESEFQLFKGGSDSVRKQLDAQSELASKEQALSKQSEELRKEFDTLANQTKALGISILHDAMPAIQTFAKFLGSADLQKSLDVTILNIKFFGRVIGWVAESIKLVIDRILDIIPGGKAIKAILFGSLGEIANAESMMEGNGNRDGAILTKDAKKRLEDLDKNSAPVDKNSAPVDKNSIVGKLVKMGWTPAQAAGMAGSLQQESGMNPGAVNPTSGAYGIAQWLGSRKKDFEKWSGRALQGSSLDEQLAFMNYELTQGKEQSAGKKIRTASTAEEAAKLHRKFYERPGEEEANDANRVKYANQFLSKSQQDSAMHASNIPLSYKQSGAANGAGNKSTTVDTNIQNINIHTQATDANGIGAAIGQTLPRFIGLGVASANTGVQ